MRTRNRRVRLTHKKKEKGHRAEFTYIICVDFCYILGEERNKKRGEGDRNKLYIIVKRRETKRERRINREPHRKHL